MPLGGNGRIGKAVQIRRVPNAVRTMPRTNATGGLVQFFMLSDT